MLEDGVDASEVFGDGDGHLDTLREGVDIITIMESLFVNYISCVMHQEDRAEKNPIISNSKLMVTLTHLSHTEMSREKSLNDKKRHLQAFAGEIN